MKELFVPYEIALLTQQKGFDKECFGLFNCQNNNEFELAKKPVTNWFSSFYLAAPLYQQLMDWFREKHNIRIVDSIHKSCMSGTLEKLYKFNIIKIDGLYTKDLLFGTSTENQYYDSYYNALNKAFEEAFKLI